MLLKVFFFKHLNLHDQIFILERSLANDVEGELIVTLTSGRPTKSLLQYRWIKLSPIELLAVGIMSTRILWEMFGEDLALPFVCFISLQWKGLEQFYRENNKWGFNWKFKWGFICKKKITWFSKASRIY